MRLSNHQTIPGAVEDPVDLGRSFHVAAASPPFVSGQVVPSRRESVGFLAEGVRYDYGGAEFPHVVFLSLLVQLGNLNGTLKAVGVDKKKNYNNNKNHQPL